ncbi:2-amino-4-hydroxy-6-hydroxymethyldihydropteridine diphosphokinase [Vagococcus elongatus]|uniref:2-amino-4-hydroxy-6- hydroxymethyldihydropteridine diphosphokinase n=1 Tax=Vagococcus elongatus TaxID=180344 RepID=UPI001B8685C2|nr:2-amino-4-hydroxy-6-hydroxymethyldihydropteridine diphosphokinase [Vagococcus elongatus]
MADIIRIKNLETFGNHGLIPEENVLGQKFFISADMYTKTRQAGKNDTMNQSIHYGEVCHEIDSFVRQKTFKLIEKVAESLAEHLLLTYPLMTGIELEIKKPWAPIGLPLDFVSIEIFRSWHDVYIGLGSNIGESEQLIHEAITQLDELETSQVVNVSKLIKTKPYGGVEQPDFINGALHLKTLLTPNELLEVLHQIEHQAGRERSIHWGPRTLDLDILLYDEELIFEENLTIPHIDMTNREFVLTPLAEIAPYAIHPASGKTILTLQQELMRESSHHSL